jgi:exopolyphosphatase/guanosine-5'-triphosphate,3'-diphosphate pyrophosphatase
MSGVPENAPAAAPAGSMMLAALDMGTNSFHLVVARIRGDGYEIVTREKQTIRLGHGGGDMKELSQDAMDRGITALRRMKQIADRHDAAVRAIATSAVREALNRNVFIRRAWREAGIRVDIVSGLEEARLIHLGVLQAVPAYDRRLILVDIGGGSTEVLVGERGETLAARSFKLGAVRLTDRFFPGGRIARAPSPSAGRTSTP